VKKYGGAAVDQGFKFPNHRAARQAASEIVGNLGSETKAIRARDWTGGPYLDARVPMNQLAGGTTSWAMPGIITKWAHT
jgi:hypothetical protein